MNKTIDHYQERVSALRRTRDWYRGEATPEERQLRLQAIEYEECYFKDLTLQDRRIRRKLGGCKTKIDGRWVKVEEDLQEDVSVSDSWIFHYRRLRRGDHGRCRLKECTIDIKVGLTGDELKGTLLHEMIHAYEGMLWPIYREWLLLDLYKRMEKRIGRNAVSRFLDLDAHTVMLLPAHGLMFLLKALELDERLGWKRGTVFGYGRDEW